MPVVSNFHNDERSTFSMKKGEKQNVLKIWTRFVQYQVLYVFPVFEAKLQHCVA